MPERDREAPVDYGRLARHMRALSYPARLELLVQLRFARTLGEVKLAPQRGAGGPARAAARQTVRVHLAKLVEAGLVRAEPEEPGSKALRYTANPQRVYALTEDLRRLSTLYAARSGPAEATGTLAGPAEPARVEGPRLVLVHGVYEGKTFALSPESARAGRWIIGRRRDLPVCLDYDPFVSLENAAVARRGAGYELDDLPGSKNGTLLNWALLPRGGSRPLRASDVIGVGRSLLVFDPG